MRSGYIYDLSLLLLVYMVNIRCPKFDDTTWIYVVKYAELKGISRCKALEKIVQEHMKILAETQRKIYEKGKKNV